ncbi:hypothetical protein LEMLEM_LOCUS6883 [Lemmus lemmus]
MVIRVWSLMRFLIKGSMAGGGGGGQSTLLMTRSCWGPVTRARLPYGRPRRWCHQPCTSSASMRASRWVWRCHSSQPLQILTSELPTPGTHASFPAWQLCQWPPPRPENTPRRAGEYMKEHSK